MTTLATDDVITVPIPAALAAKFITEESHRTASSRELLPLRLGDQDLGMWRIDGIASQANDGAPRVVAMLRRCWP